jgi:type I restriction enzyme M protein
MTEIVIGNDKDTLNQEGLIRTIYDPCCGTGGLLMFGKSHIQEKINEKVKVEIFGQEANEQSYAIAKSDLLITGEDSENIKHGNTLTEDQFPHKKFNYMLANPPYGVNWKKDKAFIDAESLNPAGRFSIGLPRVSDGQMLFISHMLSKMDPAGCRIGIVTSGSPLFTGDAGSGESEIRRYLIENDLVEAIVGMPGDLFYNTGIGTYVWFICNNKASARKGKIQLINAAQLATPEKKSLGNKRNKLNVNNRLEIKHIYTEFQESEISKIFPNEYFGYLNIPVEQPLLNKNGEPMLDKKGNVQADSKLRDSERVALTVDPEVYFEKEVKPHLPNAWFDYDNARIGYEINFTKYFYSYKPLRSVNEIIFDLKKLEEESDGLFNNILN